MKIDDALIEEVAKSIREMAPISDGRMAARNAIATILTAVAEEGYVIEQGWRPIETAPSSDETVLVFGGRFSKPTAVLADGEYWRVNRVLRGVPTHWRPLPDPPAMVSKAEEPGQ